MLYYTVSIAERPARRFVSVEICLTVVRITDYVSASAALSKFGRMSHRIILNPTETRNLNLFKNPKWRTTVKLF